MTDRHDGSRPGGAGLSALERRMAALGAAASPPRPDGAGALLADRVLV